MSQFTSNAARRWSSLKRAEHRRSLRHAGRDEVVQLNLRGSTIRGRLVNISHDGIAVLLPQIVTTGAHVDFACGDLEVAGSGTVRHVREREGRYMLGIQFDAGTAWTPDEAGASSSFWKWDWQS